MIQSAKILPLSELSATDAEAWEAFRASDRALASPYFALDYLRLLDAVYPGVEVMRVDSGGTTIGFLPFRRDFLGTARTPDGLLGDLHGVIADANTEVELAQLMKSGQIGGYAFSAVPFQQARHGLQGFHGDGNQILDLTSGYEGYLKERYAASSSFRRTHRKIEKLLERSDVEITHGLFDETVFKRLIELKQEGYAGAGHFDVFSLGWPELLLRRLIESTDMSVSGVLSTMTIGGEFAAACFCMRSNRVLHYWFPGYEKAFADLKPGHALLFSIAEWAASQGLHEFHLGLGDIQYKRQMASFAAPVRAGTVAVGAPQKLLAQFFAWSTAREARNAAFGKLSAKAARKLERVAAVGNLRA